MTSAAMKVIIIMAIIVFVHYKYNYSKQLVKSISFLCNCVLLFCTDYKKVTFEFLTPCVFYLYQIKATERLYNYLLIVFFVSFNLGARILAPY